MAASKKELADKPHAVKVVFSFAHCHKAITNVPMTSKTIPWGT